MQSLIPPFDAYAGDKPYIFVSYAHKNSDIVYNHISKLHDAGFRIWYDEGIDPGADWSDEIATALQGCAVFLVFISEASLASHNVRKEIIFAIDQRKHMLCVHIEEVELPVGLKMQLGNIQALLETRFHDKEKFYRRLHEGILPAQTLRTEDETFTKADKQHITIKDSAPSAPRKNTAQAPAKSSKNTLIALLIGALVLAAAGMGYMWTQQPASTITPTESAENVKKEVSDNPRKELANMGVSWNVEAYLDQVELSDMHTLKLFYAGGFDPYTKLSFTDAHNYIENLTSYEHYAALSSLAPMPAVAFEIWSSEKARSVMKLALEYGYSLKNDTAFLENFTEKLDSMILANILNEKQVTETLLFLKSIDKSILETLKKAHEDIVTSLQNNTYTNYVDTLEISTQKNMLEHKKSFVQSAIHNLNTKADTPIAKKVFQRSVDNAQADLKKAEEDLAKLIEARRLKKLAFHENQIKIIEGLM